jgi:superfamily I DNA/RNA helicase
MALALEAPLGAAALLHDEDAQMQEAALAAAAAASVPRQLPLAVYRALGVAPPGPVRAARRGASSWHADDPGALRCPAEGPLEFGVRAAADPATRVLQQADADESQRALEAAGSASQQRDEGEPPPEEAEAEEPEAAAPAGAAVGSALSAALSDWPVEHRSVENVLNELLRQVDERARRVADWHVELQRKQGRVRHRAACTRRAPPTHALTPVARRCQDVLLETKDLPNMEWLKTAVLREAASTEEACGVLARLVAMLDAFSRFWVDTETRPAKLAFVMGAFGAYWMAKEPLREIGKWCTLERQNMHRWLQGRFGPPALLGLTPLPSPATLRMRMARLLWDLGERFFPLGVRTVRHGGQQSDSELAALGWWLQLPLDDAAAALEHAEAQLQPCLGALGAAIGKYEAHARLSAALLSSPTFQNRAQQIVAFAPGALDKWQNAAAGYHDDRSLHIGAGPGAGKTRTIVARAVHVLASALTQPDARMCCEDVVAVTFTNRAVDSLREKLTEMGVPRITVCTMDSYLLSFIKDVRWRARMPRQLWLYTDREKREQCQKEAEISGDSELAQQQCEGRSLEEIMLAAMACPQHAEAVKEAVKALLKTASRHYRAHATFSWAAPSEALLADVATEIKLLWTAKQQASLALVTPVVLQPRGPKPADAEVVVAHLSRLLRAFAERVGATGGAAYDFDKELLALALIGGAEVAHAPEWARAAAGAASVVVQLARRKHFVIDEFQDTSPAQLRAFMALARDGDGSCGARLTVVGDSDQSIYGFRGACFKSLDEELRAGCGQRGVEYRPLLLNYRSTPAIVAACRALIAPNYADQPDALKELRAKNHGGGSVRLVECANALVEFEHVLNTIRALEAQGVQRKQMAVLFRQLPGDGQQGAFMDFLKSSGFGAYSLLKDKAVPADHQPNNVVVGSIHAAKGLEWRAVFVVGVCTALQASMSMAEASGRSAEEVQALRREERRVMYVAMSRAREFLDVTHSGTHSHCSYIEDLARASWPNDAGAQPQWPCVVRVKGGAPLDVELAAAGSGNEHSGSDLDV